MEIHRKCQLLVCECLTPAGSLYCSEYCRQAATQAIPRDFCQCSHTICEQPMTVQEQIGNEPDLPVTIYTAPGRLTVDYVDTNDLLCQLQWLTLALTKEPGLLSIPGITTQRRGPGIEQGRQAAAAQSA